MAEYRQAICPVCGRSAGTEVIETVPGKPYIKLAKRSYWERIKEFDPDKPFGVIQETVGRGSFRLIGYFNPEEDKDGYYPLIKLSLLNAIKAWLDKGWLTREELNEAIK